MGAAAAPDLSSTSRILPFFQPLFLGPYVSALSLARLPFFRRCALPPKKQTRPHSHLLHPSGGPGAAGAAASAGDSAGAAAAAGAAAGAVSAAASATAGAASSAGGLQPAKAMAATSAVAASVRFIPYRP